MAGRATDGEFDAPKDVMRGLVVKSGVASLCSALSCPQSRLILWTFVVVRSALTPCKTSKNVAARIWQNTAMVFVVPLVRSVRRESSTCSCKRRRREALFTRSRT